MFLFVGSLVCLFVVFDNERVYCTELGAFLFNYIFLQIKITVKPSINGEQHATKSHGQQ